MIRYNLFTILFTVLVLWSCNDELDRINKNPNSSAESEPAFLLTGTLKQMADLYWGSENNYNSTLLFVQHWAKIQYTEQDRYDFSNTSFTTLWNNGYSIVATNLEDIKQSNKSNQNYIGIAQILQSWIFQVMTDSYGDIPYSEYGKNRIPKYDSQKDVYLGLLSDLEEAITLLNTANGSVEGDLIYGGDITKWKKFANSLRLRIALRIADNEPELAKQTINNLLNDGIGVFSNNEDTFKFIYTKSPQQNPIAAIFENRDDHRVSKTLIDKLIELNDPRLPVYAQLPQDTSVLYYAGGANGLSNSDANSQGFAKLSKPGTFFLKSESPAVLLSYAEVLFGLSEAISRDYISGDADIYYNNAIIASFNQFGITENSIIADYLEQPSVQFNASDYKKSIGIQKWIALYGQGLEAFAEWRRLDYPVLHAGTATVLEGKIPLRFFYPGTEQSLNGKNYQAAINNQGTDLLTTKLWFDKY